VVDPRNVSDKLKTVEQGAATTVWAATSPLRDGKGGVYCEDVDIASPTDKGAGAASGVASSATDRDTADRQRASAGPAHRSPCDRPEEAPRALLAFAGLR
jgi:hypothetical protein